MGADMPAGPSWTDWSPDRCRPRGRRPGSIMLSRNNAVCTAGRDDAADRRSAQALTRGLSSKFVPSYTAQFSPGNEAAITR